MARPGATYSQRAPDLLSSVRILLIPVLTGAALAGNGRLVGLGLVLAGATDVLDGHLARRLKAATQYGARLDALADDLLLVAALGWLLWLYPDILTTSWTIVAAACAVQVASMVAGRVRFARKMKVHSLGSKLAGGCLYGFALFTLLSSVYEPLLLAIAAGALIASSTENLLITMIDAIATSKKVLSHTPHAEKAVGTSTTAITSSPIIATPSAWE
jgi:phosphatidylglycerophosphate synthase